MNHTDLRLGVVRTAVVVLLQMLLGLQGEAAEEVGDVDHILLSTLKVPRLTLHVERDVLERFRDTYLVDVAHAQYMNSDIFWIDDCQAMLLCHLGRHRLDSGNDTCCYVACLDTSCENLGLELGPRIFV